MAEGEISYQQLDKLVCIAKEKIKQINAQKRQLIMLYAANSVNSIVYYLAALQLKHVICWADKNSSVAQLQTLQQHYGVNLFIKEGEITLLSRKSLVLHPDLALLITTSGSTGSPSLVRLSYQNLVCNCNAICQALALQMTDKTITTLPLHYSFGLSIINTHLNVCASIILSESSLISRDFWAQIKAQNITCLYGVPYTFEMLLKLSLTRLPLKSLRFMAVAGGKLSPEKVTLVNSYCLENNSQFYVMYGQTEATARITLLSPDKVTDKPFSIGKQIAGKLWLEDNSGQKITAIKQCGELCFEGDNVMMGVAENSDDLALAPQKKILRTGDLAEIDSEGDYQIVGRLKRFIKVTGHRINLDEIEHYFAKQLQVACTGKDDLIRCYLMNASEAQRAQFTTKLSEYLSIHPNYIATFSVEQFPYLSSGKLNYQQLDKEQL
jgi:acyl-CoA synthetase (AMP-forming)/AMP-acid ligase II